MLALRSIPVRMSVYSTAASFSHLIFEEVGKSLARPAPNPMLRFEINMLVMLGAFALYCTMIAVANYQLFHLKEDRLREPQVPLWQLIAATAVFVLVGAVSGVSRGFVMPAEVPTGALAITQSVFSAAAIIVLSWQATQLGRKPREISKLEEELRELATDTEKLLDRASAKQDAPTTKPN